MKTTLPFALLAVLLAAGPGCISTHETVYRDVERLKVEFENDVAARIFYETLSKYPYKQGGESHTKVNIPIIFEVSKTEKDSGNGSFNEAVRRCDTNQDGKITESEARIFAENKVR